MRRAILAGIGAAAVMATAGCTGKLLDVNLLVVGQQTALERQVLGAYGELGDDLVAYSSVRAVQPDGSLSAPPPRTASRAAVIAAMRNREYNRDDLDLTLANGVTGERADGLLERLQVPIPPVERLTPELIERVVEEENRDRRVILGRLSTTVPGVRPEDAAEVAWIFAKMNQDAAPSGAMVQTRDGEWGTK